MTAPLLDSVSCLRVDDAGVWHLPRLRLVDYPDVKRWEMHTWCGLDVTGLEYLETQAIPTCQPCVEADRPDNGRWENR